MNKYKVKQVIFILKNIVINFLIILAFAGFFENNLYVKNALYALYASLTITLFYRFIKPILMLISIIPIIFTFGLFIIIINAILIILVSRLLEPNFVITSFNSALGLAIFMSIFNFIINKDDRNIIITRIK